MQKTNSKFSHLHVHTQYSLLDGAIRIDALLKKMAEFGMDSVAITDHGTMFGVIEFYEKCLKANIKPIIGCEFYVAPRKITDKTPEDNKKLSHLVLLAKNYQGYKNLCRLATIAQLEGFYYKPRIDKEILKKYGKDLIAMSACLHGEIPRLITANKLPEAKQSAIDFVKLFGEDNFYLEVQNNGIDLQDKVNAALLDINNELSIPLVATNDCHYLNKEDVYAHEVLLCIQTGKTINQADRFRFQTDQLFFKPAEEMIRYFSDFPQSIENTTNIVNRCDIEFDFKTYHFPKYQVKNEKDSDLSPNLSIDEIFEQEVIKGFDTKLKIICKRNKNFDEKIYKKRLDYEISVIKDMGFCGYFLIVADFINYAKQNNIPVGPGRGSAAGSMVAYSLCITDLDPIEHGLIFERFLNPGRKSMPDIDVDFCINGREQVFKYVAEKYGSQEQTNTSVAQIITFGKLKTRAVIRDVGRALEIPLYEVDKIAKLVPDDLNITLDKALDKEPKLLAMTEERPEIKNLITICRVLEGLERHSSTHAAGVVIGDKPLVEYLPLYKGKKGETVTQFDMKRVEQIGLVKFDFLGLRNLTIIAKTLEFIADQKKVPPDIENLDFNDSKTYELLAQGDTTGVFQLESSGMKDLLVRLKLENFDDLIALVAIYRPGPMESGMIDDYVERKNGRKKVQYLVEELEPILKETYGVIVYQEQVMKIAGVLANYSMSDADGLRKAMGKKIPEIMAQHRKLFLKGSAENKIDPEKAKNIFDLMEKFGGYGFNKSHSAAYALIAYQTAFLKAHFPVEFLAALLTSEMQSTDGVVKYIEECRNHDVTVLPPDINESNKEFTVVEQGIRFGLHAVKNVGEAAIESIIAKRKNKPFKCLFNFCERVDSRKVNKRVIESLIKCGAFDLTGHKRSQMLAILEEAIDLGQKLQKETQSAQLSLFDFGNMKKTFKYSNMPEIKEIEDDILLSFEKESLGFYVSGHPLNQYKDLIEKFSNINSISIKEKADKQTVRVGGTIKSLKNLFTKKDQKPMAIIEIEDLYGTFESIIFPDTYQKVNEYLVIDNKIFVLGIIQKEEQGAKIIAESIVPFEKADDLWTSKLYLNINANSTQKNELVKLYHLLNKNLGTCKTDIKLVLPDKFETIISLPDSMKISYSKTLEKEINRIFGYNVVESICCEAKVTKKNNKFDKFKKKRNFNNA